MPSFLYNPEYLDQSHAEANALWASEECLAFYITQNIVIRVLQKLMPSELVKNAYFLYNPKCRDQSPAEANALWASEECLPFYITQNILIRVLQKLMPSELVKSVQFQVYAYPTNLTFLNMITVIT